jgi:integrase
LGDLARLTWANIDPTSGEIHLRTAKTGRPVRIPICVPLQQHLSQISAGDTPGSPVHPRLSALAATKTSTLSRQFGEILAAAGLAASVTHAAAKSGRGARRDQSALTFHAFRHTAVSMMKNAGVSPAIVQDLIGHESAEISAHYTHIDHESKRRALETLPDFT